MSFVEQVTEQFERQIGAYAGQSRFMRESAWEAFIQRGLPTRRVENWRYTSLRALESLSAEQAPDTISVKNLLTSIPEYFSRIVLVDGVLHPDLSDVEVILSSDSIPAQINADKHPMAVLNLALFQDGLEIHIPAGKNVEKPIALVHIGTKNSAGKLHAVNIRLKVGESSKVSVVTHHLNTSLSAQAQNILMHVSLKENARLDYSTVNMNNASALCIEGFHAEQEVGSQLNAFVFSKGSRLFRMDFNTVYLGSNSSSKITGVYLVNGQQHVDLHLNADHLAPHCTTHQSVRGVVDGNSKAVFNGRVCVHQHAVKSYSEQSNHNLVLSKTAEVFTKPELEIYNDDVKCAHGATVGQLDQDALFYLMARGLDESSALNMLRQAFIEQQFDAIEDLSIREYLRGLL